MAWTRKVEAILSCGTPLERFGVNNWMLDRAQALAVLDELARQKLAVLGGDVYELVEGRPELTYDNWYCNKNDGESVDDFTDRSINWTRHYIRNYQSPDSKEVRFVLVVEDE